MGACIVYKKGSLGLHPAGRSPDPAYFAQTRLYSRSVREAGHSLRFCIGCFGCSLIAPPVSSLDVPALRPRLARLHCSDSLH
eukprot:11210356-Lingulodinium_polyedra.AAC.1